MHKIALKLFWDVLSRVLKLLPAVRGSTNASRDENEYDVHLLHAQKREREEEEETTH